LSNPARLTVREDIGAIWTDEDFPKEKQPKLKHFKTK